MSPHRKLLFSCSALLGWALLGGAFAADRKPVTPEIASRPGGEAALRHVVWSPDGRQFVYRTGDNLSLFNAASGRSEQLVKRSEMEQRSVAVPEPERFGWKNRRVRESEVQWFPAADRLLIKAGGDLFVLTIESRDWRQLTATPLDEADPKVSPDGEGVSFRRGHELFVADVGSGKVRQLTRDSTETRWNAELDWVYPEELDLGTAHWWSPDSKKIAYLQFDVSREYLYPHADLIKLRALAEPQRFPKAGTANADVRLGVVQASGGRTRWLESAPGDSELIGRVDWLPDGTGLAVQKLNRIQNRLELRRVPLEGSPRVILEETDEHWVNLSDDLRFIEKGERFLWSSERDGYRHLYRYTIDGVEEARLTDGDWEVTGVAGVDEQKRLVYFLSTEATPLERRLYAVSLDGGQRRQLTSEPGVHSISMSPTAEYYVDRYSSMERPPRMTIHDAPTGKSTGTLAELDRQILEDYEILPAEIIKLRADDGDLFYCRLIKPAGFDPARKYPVVVFVYGGPHSQTIQNNWAGADLKQVMAHAGFLVWQLDNRGSAGRGHKWEARVYRQFGKQELADQVEGVKHLISLGFADPERVGIYGWSYGGFMVSTAMFRAPEVFRAGVAGAPVTDWHNYDTIYTERYMGIPARNEEAYRESSPVNFIGNLRGPLLFIHNIEDDNVLFQNTLQTAAKLQQAGKPFEMMIYSQKTHGVTGGEQRHLYETILRFFERHLKGPAESKPGSSGG